MPPLPLFAAASLDAPIVKRADRMVRAREFIVAALALAERLPTRQCALNLCETRLAFLLGFVAACLRRQLTLLPPNQAATTLTDIRAAHPDQYTVDDAYIEQLLRAAPNADAAIMPDWRIEADRVVALTFTSGSTGAPQAHEKTWGALVRNAQLAAEQALGGAGARLVATVPTQHVYGLETSAITTLAANCAVFDERPFFPQDIAAALHAMEAPRTLVTTPIHLRALLAEKVQLPPLRRIVSATAPLAMQMARAAEDAWNAPVVEIYGCTEAGVIAHRQTSESERWRTFTGGEIVLHGESAHYQAPQLPSAIKLQDVVETLSSTEFYLRGRSSDMIKVAGKRASLQALTQQLLDVPGVLDAAIFVPEPDMRPAALVVAPRLTAHDILAALSARIDAAFLPRPLLLLDRLPRNALGKLTREALLQTLRAQLHKTS